jgi:MFS family permease
VPPYLSRATPGPQAFDAWPARNCACRASADRLGLQLELPLDLAVAGTARARQDRLSSLRAFRHPNFVRFWVGAFVSNVGTWMETIGVGVYVTQSTGRAGWTGTVAALMYLPTLVLGPLAGALADRIDRRRLLSVLTTAQTLFAAVLAVLAFTDRLSVPVVALLAFGTGCVNALVSPVYSSLLAELVPSEDLLSALSLSSAQYNLGRIIGPSLAALAIAAGGLALAFLCNAASFVAVLVSLVLVQLPPRAEHDGQGQLWAEIVTGFRVAREDAGIRTALILTGLVSVLVAPFIALIPVYAITIFGHGAAGTSLLATAQGVGAIGAAVLTGTLADRWGRRRLVSRMTLTLGMVAAAYWLAPRFWMAAVLVALLGGAYLSTLTGVNATCMSRVSRLLQARVSSLYTMVLGVGYAVGLLALSWIGDRVGLRLTMVTTATVLTVTVAWMRRRGTLALLDGPAQFLGRGEVTFEVPTLAGPAPVRQPAARETVPS